MSRMTKTELRKLFIYQVYVRNHTESGTFSEFNKDLDRIKSLGVDVVYFMPIHEIGQKQKKGNLGCPYSIKDYRSINHEYGTLEDFKKTVDEIHKRGMKVMIDVVYNHTSYDSVLINEHPEYFYKRDGEFANRVGDWWDITDLDYTVSKDLWTYLIDTLVYWAEMGVDGFRWDVTSLLPLEFLEEAHDRVLEVNQEIVFLSESVHGSFLQYIRNQGFGGISESEIYQVFDMSYDYDIHPYFEGYLKGENTFKRFTEELKRQESVHGSFLQYIRNQGFGGISESEIYQVFDMSYDYDIHPYFEGYLKGENTFKRFTEELKRQESVYPENYIKLRNLENHDYGRFAPMVNGDLDKINNWTSLVFFLKGCTMIYAGQERIDMNRPDLFDIDRVNWNGPDISPLITKLASIVKDDAFSDGVYNIRTLDIDLFVGEYEYNGERFIGLFNVGLETGEFDISIPDGEYINLINDTKFVVKNGNMTLTNNPIIIKTKA